MPDQFLPPLSQTATALAGEEAVLWEFRLFAQVLADEIGHLRSSTPVAAVHREPGFQQGTAWIAGQLRLLDDISRGVTDYLNADHTDAWGPPGKAGDAQAVVRVARQVAAYYRQTLEWAAGMRRAELHPLLVPVAQEASQFVRPLLGPLEELGPDMARQCDTILALPPGSPATLEVGVVFGGFDRTRYKEACDQAAKAFRKGRR
jgi:hypothetical protein